MHVTEGYFIDGDRLNDALEATVLAALEQIRDDPEGRFRLFRRLLAVAQEEAGGRHLS
jgi:hypothetical protein